MENVRSERQAQRSQEKRPVARKYRYKKVEATRNKLRGGEEVTLLNGALTINVYRS